MISKKDTPVYITPEEAAQISKKAQTVTDIDRALSIKQAFLQIIAAENGALTDFDELRALAAVYEGGRMQGEREERARRKEQHTLTGSNATVTPEEAEEIRRLILAMFTGDFLPNMAKGKFENELKWIEAQMDLKRSAPFIQMTLGFYCGFQYGFEMADKMHTLK